MTTNILKVLFSKCTFRVNTQNINTVDKISNNKHIKHSDVPFNLISSDGEN